MMMKSMMLHRQQVLRRLLSTSGSTNKVSFHLLNGVRVKVYTAFNSSIEAVRDIKDSSTILFGGFGLCG